MPAEGVDNPAFRVTLDGATIHLRLSELESVAAGLGVVNAPPPHNLASLAGALRQMPSLDRAPTWELAVRHFGRHTPVPHAAGEIGMDLIHARDLLERYAHFVAATPPPAY